MTARTQHTPGPWRVGCDYCHKPMDIMGGAHLHVARVLPVVPMVGEASANARIIAAAPELLAACERLTQWVGKGIADGAYSECVLPRGAVHDLDMAEAAIRKARGTP